MELYKEGFQDLEVQGLKLHPQTSYVKWTAA
jgi:hypothetical protein